MFDCPNCQTKVPKVKALTLNRFSKVECSKCHITLTPNNKMIVKIGAVGGGVGAFAAALAFQMIGLIGVLIVLIIGGYLFVEYTVANLEFDITES